MASAGPAGTARAEDGLRASGFHEKAACIELRTEPENAAPVDVRNTVLDLLADAGVASIQAPCPKDAAHIAIRLNFAPHSIDRACGVAGEIATSMGGETPTVRPIGKSGTGACGSAPVGGRPSAWKGTLARSIIEVLGRRAHVAVALSGDPDVRQAVDPDPLQIPWHGLDPSFVMPLLIRDLERQTAHPAWTPALRTTAGGLRLQGNHARSAVPALLAALERRGVQDNESYFRGCGDALSALLVIGIEDPDHRRRLLSSLVRFLDDTQLRFGSQLRPGMEALQDSAAALAISLGAREIAMPLARFLNGPGLSPGVRQQLAETLTTWRQADAQEAAGAPPAHPGPPIIALEVESSTWRPNRKPFEVAAYLRGKLAPKFKIARGPASECDATLRAVYDEAQSTPFGRANLRGEAIGSASAYATSISFSLRLTDLRGRVLFEGKAEGDVLSVQVHSTSELYAEAMRNLKEEPVFRYPERFVSAALLRTGKPEQVYAGIALERSAPLCTRVRAAKLAGDAAPEAAIPVLLRALPQVECEQDAMTSVTRFGGAAVPALMKKLTARDMDARYFSDRYVSALVRIGEPAAAAVIAQLAVDKDWKRRCDLVDILGRIRGAGVREALKRALNDPHPEVRKRATTALEPSRSK